MTVGFVDAVKSASAELIGRLSSHLCVCVCYERRSTFVRVARDVNDSHRLIPFCE